jgi:Nucleoside-diphosphate-sugar epimerases
MMNRTSAGLRILMLGGTGMIGSAVAREAIARGHEVSVTSRSVSTRRGVADGAEHLVVDVRDQNALRQVLGDRTFDVVVNWIGFTADDVWWHPEFFAGRTDQYVFISTCVTYSRPAPLLPITESSPQRQPVFEYGRNKLEAELVLQGAFRDSGFPITIVRPSHTYDETAMPLLGGWTVIDRMRRGLPVVVHGDGTSLWTLMHVDDFAAALLPILGNVLAYGSPVNVVGDEVINWDQIHFAFARAAGVRDVKLVHRSSETIGHYVPKWDVELESERRHSLVFDTTKLHRLSPDYLQRVSFSEGARQIVAWHDSSPERRVIDDEVNRAFEAMIANP